MGAAAERAALVAAETRAVGVEVAVGFGAACRTLGSFVFVPGAVTLVEGAADAAAPSGLRMWW